MFDVIALVRRKDYPQHKLDDEDDPDNGAQYDAEPAMRSDLKMLATAEEAYFDVNINDPGRYMFVVSNRSSKSAAKVVQLQHVTVTCVE